MADSDNLLTYVRMALYDGKLKDYAKDYMQSLTPVGTVLKLASMIHPYYLYGGSWEQIGDGYYTMDATRYVGETSKGTSYATFEGWQAGSTTVNFKQGSDWEFYPISALTKPQGRIDTVDLSKSPSVGDWVKMQPVPMSMAIPCHAHSIPSGHKGFFTQSTGSGNLLRNAEGHPRTFTTTEFENGASYGSSDITYGSYVNAGWLQCDPPYLNCIFWHKISNDAGADGAQSTDGFEKPDNALFT